MCVFRTSSYVSECDHTHHVHHVTYHTCGSSWCRQVLCFDFRSLWQNKRSDWCWLHRNGFWLWRCFCVSKFMKISLKYINMKYQQYPCSLPYHDDVIKWKHFPHYWPFVRWIHRSPVNSPHEGQWRGALMFSMICTRTNGWVNNGEAGDLRRHHANYDVTVVLCQNRSGLTQDDMCTGIKAICKLTHVISIITPRNWMLVCFSIQYISTQHNSTPQKVLAAKVWAERNCLETASRCKPHVGRVNTTCHGHTVSILLIYWFTLHDDVIKWKLFRYTDPLLGESTRHRWIPFTKASNAELWSFLCSAAE